MGPSWISRAIASPESFLIRGFERCLARTDRGARMHSSAQSTERESLFAAPRDVGRFLDLAGKRTIGDFEADLPTFARRTNAFALLVRRARDDARMRANLVACLAGTMPIGTIHVENAPASEVRPRTKKARSQTRRCFYVLGSTKKRDSARGVIGSIDESDLSDVRIHCRDVSTFALRCVLLDEPPEDTASFFENLPQPRIGDVTAIRAAFDRARAIADVLCGTNAAVQHGARQLVRLPALGSSMLTELVETFLRDEGSFEQRALEPSDRIVRDAIAALRPPTATAFTRDLARRRKLVTANARKASTQKLPLVDRSSLTDRIVADIDAMRLMPESAASGPRREAFLALAEHGDRKVVPRLIARATTGDLAAIDMLAVLGDRRAGPILVELLRQDAGRDRSLEASAARSLAALEIRSASKALRELLARNPMPTWREGIERSALVGDLVAALGTLRDVASGPQLVELLEKKNQEYRAIVPTASWALGRIRHAPGLATLERLLCSPKEPVSCEAIWAVGEIGAKHPRLRRRAAALLENLFGIDAAAEIVRLVALAKTSPARQRPKSSDLRRALDCALWEPGFRKDETTRRRTWALSALEDLAAVYGRSGSSNEHFSALFVGQEAIRYFVTREEHAVRQAAHRAFAAWKVEVPETRRYYACILDDLERRGGRGALLEALRDPMGVFRHNVATRLAEQGNASSVKVMAEATANVFAEPPTATYEYDEPPRHLVAFVRALGRFNRNDGNDVLIEGLRHGNHQVRAVVAENVPTDRRFVPELLALLDDPRTFLRVRAERSLAALGVDAGRPDLDQPAIDRPIQLVEIPRPRSLQQ